MSYLSQKEAHKLGLPFGDYERQRFLKTIREHGILGNMTQDEQQR